MNSAKWTVPAAVVIFLGGLTAGATLFNTSAIAQAPAAKVTGTYRISAYGNGMGGYGCYLVDTASGDVWKADGPSEFKPVAKIKSRTANQ